MSSSGLEEMLVKARDALDSGVLTSEAQVRSAVIAPLLRALGWDPADPNQWLVEYAVGNGKVDDALFGTNGSALVFVEAKRQGNLSVKAEDQLFGYANNKGVPLLVLTDGDTWDFYLSMARGEPAERRFAHLKLTESDDLGDVAEDFRNFIARAAVLSGESDEAAKKRLKQVKDREVGRSGLEASWRALLRGPEESLRDLLIDRVEQDVGSRPEARHTENFLRRQVQAGPDAKPERRSISDPARKYGDVGAWLRAAPEGMTVEVRDAVEEWRRSLSDDVNPPPKSGNLRGFRFRGVSHSATDGWETLTTLAAVLENHKPGLLRELAEHGNKARKWPRALPHDDPRGQDGSGGPSYRPVPGHAAWLLLVHGSTKSKLGWMRQMTEMAGLTWDSDITPILT